MSLNLIVAVSNDRRRVIGNENDIPWNCPEDMNFFKYKTLHSTIIMGRKTFESLPFVLPGRTHVVLSSDTSLRERVPQGVIVLNTWNEILHWLKTRQSTEDVFFIGGAMVYIRAMDIVDTMWINKIPYDGEGDTLFPTIDESKWNMSEVKTKGFVSCVYRRK